MRAADPRGSTAIDIAEIANRSIWEFVHQAANLSLRPGTGRYSTPFRGSLFGEMRAAGVAEHLGSRRADLLWLGANPCVPASLDNILNADAADGDLAGFRTQMESGFFGSVEWLNGEARADWDPLRMPVGGWSVYRDLFQQIGHLECVAMANFIPWGSQSMKSLVSRLGDANRALLRRLLEFSDDLNVRIVQALRPQMVVVPFSLGRNRTLDAVQPLGPSLNCAHHARRHRALPQGGFTFYTAVCRRGGLEVPTVFVRHPASLRLSTESRHRLVSEVSEVLADWRDQHP